jgi:hypothetical protein
MHALTSPYPLSLGSLKVLVQIFLDRDDIRMEELEADRRAGRPKSKEFLELEARKTAETKEFETGFGKSSYTWQRFNVDVNGADEARLADSLQRSWI